jgi:hypothetical protein
MTTRISFFLPRAALRRFWPDFLATVGRQFEVAFLTQADYGTSAAWARGGMGTCACVSLRRR